MTFSLLEIILMLLFATVLVFVIYNIIGMITIERAEKRGKNEKR